MAIGASVAAVIIIILTLVLLCMWSRRWRQNQDKMMMAGGVGGYMEQLKSMPFPAIMGMQADRIRWAQYAEAMASAHNLYAVRNVERSRRILFSLLAQECFLCFPFKEQKFTGFTFILRWNAKVLGIPPVPIETGNFTTFVTEFNAEKIRSRSGNESEIPFLCFCFMASPSFLC